MSLKEIYRNKWVRLGILTVLYVLWLIWLENFWLIFGLPVLVGCIWGRNKLAEKADRSGSKLWRSVFGWADALVFALVFVTFVNMFFIQAFEIPSSSMEGTLYTGDHLFVSKLTYGPRMPQTPLTIPFTHNVIGGSESYSEAIKWEGRRLKGFRSVENGDIVVFGFPDGDTVLVKAPMDDYYALKRIYGRDSTIAMFGPVIVRPMDKKDHYVKRCVGIAGDTLQVKEGAVLVNGSPLEDYPGVQMTYRVSVKNGRPFRESKLEDLEINPEDVGYFSYEDSAYLELPLNSEQLEKVKNMTGVSDVRMNIDSYPPDELKGYLSIFPFSLDYKWTRDNFGPIWIPKEGVTVKLDLKTLPLYERIITSYEHNTLEVRDGEIMINGEKTENYTFRQNYYFMMGDNRHNSLDSRYWGFVPEDHIVGTPLFIWLSTDRNKSFPFNIRWSRFFNFV